MRRTAVSEWLIRWASSAGVEKVDMGMTTAPAAVAPKNAATASGRLLMRMPTRAPLASDAARRAFVTRRASRARSA